MNTDKSKIIRGRKGGGRKRKITCKLNNEESEEVKEYNYLGYIIKQNNSSEKQIRNLRKQAIAVVGKVWSIAVKNFKEN